MINDLRDIVTVTLAKRMASPFLSSFFLSWLVFNYDIVLMVFSSAQWDMKVQYINGLFGDSIFIARNYVPLATGLFYVGVWPGIDMMLFRINKNWFRRFKELQKRIEDETPLTRAEESALKEQMRITQSQLRDEIYEKDNRINELNARVKELMLIERKVAVGKPLKAFPGDDTDDIDGSLTTHIEESSLENSKTRVSPFFEEGNLNTSAAGDSETVEQVLDSRKNSKSSEDSLNKDIPNYYDEQHEHEHEHEGLREDGVSIDKNYSYRFIIDPEVTRSLSRNGFNPITEKTISFTRSELRQDVWALFHDRHWDSLKSRLPSSGWIQHQDGANKTLDKWIYKQDPNGKSSAQLLEEWYIDQINNQGNGKNYHQIYNFGLNGGDQVY